MNVVNPLKKDTLYDSLASLYHHFNATEKKHAKQLQYAREKNFKHFECWKMHCHSHTCKSQASQKCCNFATLLQRRTRNKSLHCNWSCTFTGTLNECRESILKWIHNQKPFTCCCCIHYISVYLLSYQSYYFKLCVPTAIAYILRQTIGNTFKPHTQHLSASHSKSDQNDTTGSNFQLAYTICIYVTMLALFACLHFKTPNIVWQFG